MPTPSEAKTKAATTYNAAADAYDLSANSFWDRFGRRTIDRIDLSPGALPRRLLRQWGLSDTCGEKGGASWLCARG